MLEENAQSSTLQGNKRTSDKEKDKMKKYQEMEDQGYLEHEKRGSCTCDFRCTGMYNEETGWIVWKTGYHSEYSTFTEDDIIRNSKDIEKSTWVLKDNDSKGPLVKGFDQLPWDINSALRTASAWSRSIR